MLLNLVLSTKEHAKNLKEHSKRISISLIPYWLSSGKLWVQKRSHLFYNVQIILKGLKNTFTRMLQHLNQ
jgi:hypothetical protein